MPTCLAPSSVQLNSQFFLLCGAPHNKKNWLFAGSERAGRRAVAIQSLFATASSMDSILHAGWPTPSNNSQLAPTAGSTHTATVRKLYTALSSNGRWGGWTLTLLARLASAVPDAYAGTSQLRTLQRRVQQWRAEQAKNMVLGSLELARLSA
jgi:hypothetical protein